MRKHFCLIGIAMLFAIGCAGQATQMKMRDEAGGLKTLDFPKGTILGGASKEQATALAKASVDSHNMVMKELEEIKAFEIRSRESQETLKGAARRAEGSLQRLEDSTQRIEELNKRIVELSQASHEKTEKLVEMIERLSKKQGTGEVTLFFSTGSARIKKDSPEYQRLIRFLDYLSTESRGRKVWFVSIGSASAFGGKKVNEKLAKQRSEAPKGIIDKYLVHIAHEFFKVYGTGDAYSPKNVSKEEHQRYQNVRLIAFYDPGEIPALPKEPELK